MAPFSLRELSRSTPTVVWLISIVWVLLLVLWSVLPPIFRAPDEPQHIDLVLDTRQFGPLQWTTPEGNDVGRVVEQAQQAFAYLDPESAQQSGAQAERRAGGLSASQALQRSQRPTYAELFAGEGLLGRRGNQMAQHPPLYYRLAGYALTALPGWQDLSFDVVVGLLRLLSVAFLAPMPVLAAATIRVLGGGRNEVVVAALMPFVIPQLAHIGSVVTNDSLLIAATALLTLLACRVVSGDHSRRTGQWIGGALLVALLTKGFALFLPFAVGAAYLAAWRSRPADRRAIRRSATWVVGIAAWSLWWYGENLLRFGSLQPSVLPPPVPEVQGGLSDFARIAWRVQTQTFWGRVGWAEVGVSAATATAASICLVLVVAVGAWRRRGLLLALLVLPGAAVVLSTLLRSYTNYGTDGMIRAVQGRYAFLSLIGMFVLATWGICRLLPARIRPWAWTLPVAAAVALHTDVWIRSLRHFWTTQDDAPLREAVETLVVWSPWSSRVLLALGVLKAAAIIATLIVLVVTSLRTPTPGVQHPSDPAQGDEEDDHQAREQHEGVTTT